jgi:hypothetical protein
MKILITGLIFCAFSTLAFARATTSTASKSSTLLLRGRVPASTDLEWEKGDKSSVPKIKTNGHNIYPKLVLKDKKTHRQITIIYP